MKTTILISSFAALCLLVTFAEAPRRHGEKRMNSISTGNISILALNRPSMLSGVVITAHRKTETGILVPVIPDNNFSYLTFDVTEYMESESSNLDEAEMLPEARENDYSYLKFNTGSYSSEGEFAGDEMPELPVNESNSADILVPDPAVPDFGYLRFDVNDFISNSASEDGQTGELPLDAVKTFKQDKISVTDNATSEFSYLTYYVTKYYSVENGGSDAQPELPEK